MSVNANSINYWRNPKSKNLRLGIAMIENDEYEIFNCEFNQNLIEDWDSAFSPRLYYLFSNQYGENESIKTDIQLEFLFISWFIDNWYEINGHKLANTKQGIIKNSSVIGFDFNSMNYDYALGSEGENEYKYSFKLNKQQTTKILSVFKFERGYKNSIKRCLSNNQEIVDLELSRNKLSYKNLPELYLTDIEEANSTRKKIII